jgi:hypothetical protein
MGLAPRARMVAIFSALRMSRSAIGSSRLAAIVLFKLPLRPRRAGGVSGSRVRIRRSRKRTFVVAVSELLVYNSEQPYQFPVRTAAMAEHLPVDSAGLMAVAPRKLPSFRHGRKSEAQKIDTLGA